jgi:hypothetical protein
MADLTEVCVRINLGTAVGARHLADGLTALGTEHRLGIVDGTTEGTCLTGSLSLLCLLHRLMGGVGLLRSKGLLGSHGPVEHLLGSYSGLQVACLRVIFVNHLVIVNCCSYNSQLQR